VFVNLLENAAKYTPPGSRIRISARAEGSSLRVEIADNGPGIRVGQEAAVFEKFAARQPRVGGRPASVSV
jgi:two-component system sensor histidine kinase KdpD